MNETDCGKPVRRNGVAYPRRFHHEGTHAQECCDLCVRIHLTAPCGLRRTAERVSEMAGGPIAAGDGQARHGAVSEYAASIVTRSSQSAVHRLSRVGHVVRGLDLCKAQ